MCNLLAPIYFSQMQNSRKHVAKYMEKYLDI